MVVSLKSGTRYPCVSYHFLQFGVGYTCFFPDFKRTQIHPIHPPSSNPLGKHRWDEKRLAEIVAPRVPCPGILPMDRKNDDKPMEIAMLGKKMMINIDQPVDGMGYPSFRPTHIYQNLPSGNLT